MLCRLPGPLSLHIEQLAMYRVDLKEWNTSDTGKPDDLVQSPAPARPPHIVQLCNIGPLVVGPGVEEIDRYVGEIVERSRAGDSPARQVTVRNNIIDLMGG
jgi:hypothetical protein